MMSNDEDDALVRLDRHRSSGGARYHEGSPSPRRRYARSLSISSPPSPSPVPRRSHHLLSKPNPRLLPFFQAIVMVVAISLFFIFLGIAAVFLVHICIAGGALHRRRRRSRYHSSGDEGIELDAGLFRNELRKLPCFDYGAVVEPGVTRDCAVCLESFREGDRCRILPQCKHLFHANCVDKWLIKVPACPICRCCVELDVGKKYGRGYEGFRDVETIGFDAD